MPTFKTFDTDDIVVNNPTEVTTGMWTGGTGSLVQFFSGSETSSLSGQYYYNAYNINTTSSLAQIQFAVAYGHRTGGGNVTLLQSNTATLSTQAIYSQYRNLLLDPGDSQFTFLNGVNSDHIYVINIARAQLKQQLDPGNWLLTLHGFSGSYTFIDDSGQTLGPSFGKTGNIFNVVSGSLTGTSGSTVANTTASNGAGFGLVYPELGIIVLNPDAISRTIGMFSGSYAISSSAAFAPDTSSIAAYNHVGFFNAIAQGKDFQARSAETISSTVYFIRLRNKEFNYSNNPTFSDPTTGFVNNSDFVQNPVVFPTTVGMFNDQNELLAVAKLSQPTPKSFDSELLIKTRIDW